MRDPEFWFPLGEAPPRVGRRKVSTLRSLKDYPPPTPQPTPCRLWQGPVDRYGYGVLAGRGKVHSANHQPQTRVHRWVWEMANGPIPAGLVVRHRCDNRPCYRLSHLELGTVADNNRDARDRNHLGTARAMPPSVVREIWRRKQAGETYVAIHRDYPEYSLPTVKRVKDYITECLDLNTDSLTADPATPPTASDAAVAPAPPPTPPTDDASKGDPNPTPRSTTPG